jgi:hypothetical protein
MEQEAEYSHLKARTETFLSLSQEVITSIIAIEITKSTSKEVSFILSCAFQSI